VAGGQSSRGTHADDCWTVILGDRALGSTAGGEGRCGCGESFEESEKETAESEAAVAVAVAVASIWENQRVGSQCHVNLDGPERFRSTVGFLKTRGTS
jgi:hypothetical protein